MARPIRRFGYFLARELGWVGPIDGFLAQYRMADLYEWRAWFALQAEQQQSDALASAAVAGADQRLEALRKHR